MKKIEMSLEGKQVME